MDSDPNAEWNSLMLLAFGAMIFQREEYIHNEADTYTGRIVYR
jgi:hypothetical protein